MMNNLPAMPDIEVSQDGILGRQYHLYQPKQGYRFGTDAILLAAAVEAQNGRRVAEFGAGVGAVSIAAWHRLSDIHITAIEKDPSLAALLAHNIHDNQAADHIRPLEADITDLPPMLFGSFDQVIANPPFHHPASPPSRNRRRALAHHGDGASLDEWVGSALKMLKPKGRLTYIMRADRLDEMIIALAKFGAGDITVLPIWPYKSSPAIRVIITARKGVTAPFTLLDGLVLHHPDGGLTARADDVLQGKSVGLMSHILSTPSEGTSS